MGIWGVLCVCVWGGGVGVSVCLCVFVHINRCRRNVSTHPPHICISVNVHLPAASFLSERQIYTMAGNSSAAKASD